MAMDLSKIEKWRYRDIKEPYLFAELSTFGNPI